MINNVQSLFTFFFVFSILVIIRIGFKVIGALLQNEPQPLVLSNRELIILGTSISYFITYIIN